MRIDIAHADEFDAVGEHGGFVMEDVNTFASENLAHARRCGAAAETGVEPVAAVVIAEDGVGGGGLGSAAEDAAEAGLIEAMGGGDVVACEADDIGAMFKAHFQGAEEGRRG